MTLTSLQSAVHQQTAMSENLKPAQPPSHAQSLRDDSVRRLSRSPHPYHRQKFEIPYASEKFSTNTPPTQSPLRSAQNTDDEGQETSSLLPEGYREPINSESGTEADDEHFLKGLPAPKLRPHKGLRGAEGTWSSTPSPLLSPAILDEDVQKIPPNSRRAAISAALSEEELRRAAERYRHKRRVEIVRRATEAAILVLVGAILGLNREVRQLLRLWKRGKFEFAFELDLTDGGRINVSGSCHNISNCDVPHKNATPHRSCTTMEETISFTHPSIFRSCAFTIPACDHYARLHAHIHHQSCWLSAEHHTGNFFSSKTTDSIHWRA